MGVRSVQKSLPKQDKLDRRRVSGHKGQGHTDSRVKCRSATSVALLMELKAQVL